MGQGWRADKCSAISRQCTKYQLLFKGEPILPLGAERIQGCSRGNSERRREGGSRRPVEETNTWPAEELAWPGLPQASRPAKDEGI